MPSLIQNIFNKLTEENGGDFRYLNDTDDKPHNGNMETSLAGKEDGEKEGKPVVGDRIAKMLTVDPYYARAARGLGAHTGSITESGEDDKNEDNIDDFYNHDDLNTLNDDNPDNNLTRMPKTVEHRLSQLITDIKNANLNERQIAMVISKLLTSCDLSNLNPVWRKELKLKINAQTKQQ